jgi:hypothetical protein
VNFVMVFAFVEEGTINALSFWTLNSMFSSLQTGKRKGQSTMMREPSNERSGDLRWGLAAMILGLPLPFVIIAFLCGGCHGGGNY